MKDKANALPHGQSCPIKGNDMSNKREVTVQDVKAMISVVKKADEVSRNMES